MALLFENETCSRCGGSGQYSYCQRYGTTCFKCAGLTVTLTKRGTAAQVYYRSLLSKPVSELQPGMIIQTDGITMGGDLYTTWATITEIKPDTTFYNGVQLAHYRNIMCTTKRGEVHSIGVPITSKFRVAATVAVKAEAYRKALEYQLSLNKQGRPDKVLAKLVAQVAYA
jgi:hypothetical protein